MYQRRGCAQMKSHTAEEKKTRSIWQSHDKYDPVLLSLIPDTPCSIVLLIDFVLMFLAYQFYLHCSSYVFSFEIHTA